MINSDEQKVQCKICDKYFHELQNHIVRTHNMSLEDYCSKYNINRYDLLSKYGRENREKIAQKGLDIIKFKRENDEDYNKMVAENISKAILNDEKEMKRRIEALNKFNETYTKEQRSEYVKKKWKEDYDYMYQFTILWRKDKDKQANANLKMLKSRKRQRQSKNEIKIIEYLKQKYSLCKVKFFINDHYRFYDINVENYLLIEIDGIYHFKEGGSFNLKQDFIIDYQKSKFAIDNNFYMLRISNCYINIDIQKMVIDYFINKIKEKQINKNRVYYFGEDYKNVNWYDLKTSELKIENDEVIIYDK